MTDELIERLVQDLKPVPANALPKLLGIAAAFGLVASAIAMMLWLGPRPDMSPAFGTSIFWTKFSYTLALGCGGAWAASRIARPGEYGRLPLGTVGIAVLLLATAAGVSYVMTPVEDRHAIVMGSSALVCPHYIVALSMPLLIAAIVFMRHMAPTSPTLAGLSGGLMAGGLGAWVYSFHCTESGLPFLALWYSLGVAVVALAGAASGRLLLRW